MEVQLREAVDDAAKQRAAFEKQVAELQAQVKALGTGPVWKRAFFLVRELESFDFLDTIF